MARKPKIAKIKDFDEDISEGNIIVDFYADWCEYCKKMATIVRKLSSIFEEVKFFRMNIDDNMEVAETYCAEGIPNLVLFKDGEYQDEFLGYDTITPAKKWLTKALSGDIEEE